MHDLTSIKTEIKKMAETSFRMLTMTFQAFMDHDMDVLQAVLNDEQTLNAYERDITAHLVEYGKGATGKKENAEVKIYVDVVGDLELVGDYCKDILERVQIKIEERLLFSDEAVKEYVDLYKKTETAFRKVLVAIEQESYACAKEALSEEKAMEKLVEEYRARHTQRLIKGVCSPLACNMFLNMVDFTMEIYLHVRKIARNLSKIRK
jgi:phosphate:Na+ symporter